MNMKKVFPAIILFSVFSFANTVNAQEQKAVKSEVKATRAHSKADQDAKEKATPASQATPATPATQATPAVKATPATKATPASPATPPTKAAPAAKTTPATPASPASKTDSNKKGNGSDAKPAQPAVEKGSSKNKEAAPLNNEKE